MEHNGASIVRPPSPCLAPSSRHSLGSGMLRRLAKVESMRAGEPTSRTTPCHMPHFFFAEKLTPSSPDSTTNSHSSSPNASRKTGRSSQSSTPSNHGGE